MQVTLLDCTLRDGGYYTQWDFNRPVVDTYIEACNHLPIDYLEVGYRSLPQDAYRGEYFYCPMPVLERVREQSDKKLAVLVDEKNVRSEDVDRVLGPCTDIIDLVRIAVKPSFFGRALALGEAVKAQGFGVSFNVMYMSDWEKSPDLFDLMREVDGIVDYLYLVDSYGGVFPDDVERAIGQLRSITDVPLGFHGHNNLQMALTNTLRAIESGVSIVDATVTGMGRGAGNLRTELLLTVLNAREGIDFDFNWLSKVVDPFRTLKNKHGWGTNLPYMVSGANSIPQAQVMEWVSQRYYSFNSIIRALNNQSNGVEDNRKLPTLDFSKERDYSGALIVGGGPSAAKHAEALHHFAASRPDLAIIHASSKNALSFQDVSNDQYFCLIGNEGYRMERVFGAQKVRGRCILPPFPRKMGTYIPSALEDQTYELGTLNVADDPPESHTSIALQAVRDLNLDTVYLAGYDGYAESEMGKKEQALFRENERLFEEATNVLQASLVSITPTKYTQLQQGSVYTKI